MIERIFGVLKRKYRVLAHPAEYSTQTQVLLVTALTALHNFVRQREGPNADNYLSDISEVEEERGEESDQSIQPSIFESSNSPPSKVMEAFRNQISERMWKDYRRYQRSHT